MIHRLGIDSRRGLHPPYMAAEVDENIFNDELTGEFALQYPTMCHMN